MFLMPLLVAGMVYDIELITLYSMLVKYIYIYILYGYVIGIWYTVWDDYTVYVALFVIKLLVFPGTVFQLATHPHMSDASVAGEVITTKQ